MNLKELLKPRTWDVRCPDCHGHPTRTDGSWGSNGQRPRVVWTCPTCKGKGTVRVQQSEGS